MNWSVGEVTITKKSNININPNSYTKRMKILDENNKWIDTRPLVLKDGEIINNLSLIVRPDFSLIVRPSIKLRLWFEIYHKYLPLPVPYKSSLYFLSSLYLHNSSSNQLDIDLFPSLLAVIYLPLPLPVVNLPPVIYLLSNNPLDYTNLLHYTTVDNNLVSVIYLGDLAYPLDPKVLNDLKNSSMKNKLYFYLLILQYIAFEVFWYMKNKLWLWIPFNFIIGVLLGSSLENLLSSF